MRSLDLLLLLDVGPLHTEDRPDNALRHATARRGSSIGTWAVATEFLKADGSIANSVQGSCSLSWAVLDRVVSGRIAIPELRQSAGILVYIDEARSRIEMVSVAGDG